MISTIGASFAFSPRARNAISTLSRLSSSSRRLFVILARERLHHADRRQDFLDGRNDLALLLADLARGFLDQPRVVEHDQEQQRRHRQRDQRESPVDVEHHRDHADQRDAVDQCAQQSRSEKALHRVDIGSDAADQVARLLLIVIGDRQPLHVRVQRDRRRSCITHWPDAGGEVFLRVGADRPEYGDRPAQQPPTNSQYREFVRPCDCGDQLHSASHATA